MTSFRFDVHIQTASRAVYSLLNQVGTYFSSKYSSASWRHAWCFGKEWFLQSESQCSGMMLLQMNDSTSMIVLFCCCSHWHLVVRYRFCMFKPANFKSNEWQWYPNNYCKLKINMATPPILPSGRISGLLPKPFARHELQWSKECHRILPEPFDSK